MYLFDQLIANVDRHMNNILITDDWDLRLIDHSRSFRTTKELKDPALFTRFSRDLVEGIKKLEYQDMRKKVGKYLMDEQIKDDALPPRPDPEARRRARRRRWEKLRSSTDGLTAVLIDGRPRVALDFQCGRASAGKNSPPSMPVSIWTMRPFELGRMR
jgi:hypothetical protein